MEASITLLMLLFLRLSHHSTLIIRLQAICILLHIQIYMNYIGVAIYPPLGRVDVIKSSFYYWNKYNFSPFTHCSNPMLVEEREKRGRPCPQRPPLIKMKSYPITMGNIVSEYNILYMVIGVCLKKPRSFSIYTNIYKGKVYRH